MGPNMDAMKLRKKRLQRREAQRLEEDADVCPGCGHRSRRGVDKLIDPITRRVVCVRCGAEIGEEHR